MGIRRAGILALWLHLAPLPAMPSGQDPGALPTVVTTELKRLEETYRVLDTVADRIWPGWKDYRQVPFLLEYENGSKVLAGHPNPPKEFQPVPGSRVGNSQVNADRTGLVAKELVAPLRAGGGPIGFGSTPDGRSVEVVHMQFTPARESEADRAAGEGGRFTTEEQILIYIHELFHCFQRSHLRNRIYGNLQYNADAEYALYSEIEGLALHRAYQETDPEQAKQRIKDFLVARALKRGASMSELQGNQESSDEFNEGTATYAEVRTLEALRGGGFTQGLSIAQDPDYSGFRNIESLMPHYARRLLRDASNAEHPGSKGYTYGCFQALLCQRLYPGWQQAVIAGSGFMDRELAKQLPISEEERPQIEKRLRETYPVTEIRERNAGFLNARDDAYRKLRSRAGRTYVLDFKPTRQYMSSVVGNKGAYRLGLIGLYPGGLGPVQFDEVDLSRIAVPAEVNQLYYIRTVDPSPRNGEAPFAIEGASQADGSWRAATVHTPLFTLKAPHVRVKQIGNLVKIRVLSRVK